MTVDEQIRRLPPHNLDDRRARVLEAMAAAKLDRVLVASNGQHMIDAPNPLFHLTGFRSVGPAIAIMERDGSLRALATPADDVERIARSFPDGAAVDSLPDALLKFLFRFSSAGTGHVGLGAMPFRVAEIILAALGEAGVAFDAVFDRATAVKTTQEIACALQATRIAQEGRRKLRELARPGMRECDLAVAVNLFMRGQEADDCFLMLNAAARAEAVMPSSERPMEQGDLILCELSPSVGGQFIQICRTLKLGEPERGQLEAYDLLVRAMHAGISRAKPGARVGDLCGAIDDLLSQAGFQAFSRPPFIRRRGHGLGAGSIFPGDVAIDNATTLEPGMLLVVHPNQFLPQSGYMMCGESIVVGADGPIVLTTEQASLDCAGAST
jgi:Xaa-Pro aminopeptidase